MWKQDLEGERRYLIVFFPEVGLGTISESQANVVQLSLLEASSP